MCLTVELKEIWKFVFEEEHRIESPNHHRPYSSFAYVHNEGERGF